MLNQAQVQEIFARIQKLSPIRDVEVLFQGGRSALTRFANNTIHQNVAEESNVVSIRVLLDGRDSRVTTNKTDDASLKRALESAVAIAKVQERDPDMLPLPTREPDALGPAPARHFPETAAITPQDRAEAVGRIVQVAQQNQLTTAGIFSTSETFEAIANSAGLFDYHTQTSSEISITMLAADSSGWQKANSPDVRNLDAAALAETAARKARDSAAPRELPPGKYTVILEPAAVLDLLGFMFWDFGGLSVLDQRSFLLNRIGTRLFGQNISIVDDVYHPLQSGAAFDGEGLRRQRVSLVEKGVIKQLVYARGTAEKMKKSELANNFGPVAVTGHGFPLPNEMGEAPLNLVIENTGEQTSLDEMIAGTERGILVTRFWYIREVEPYEKVLTGMTRDGTFLVQNGKVVHGLRNFRFNQSLVELLNHVEQMGTPVRASGEECFDMVVPPMKVRDFNFTEVTKF